MNRRALNIIGILILMGITAGVSIIAYTFVVGGSGEASQPISAPTLDPSTPTPNALETQVAELQAQNATLVAELAAVGAPEVATEEATAEATVEATEEAAADATAEVADATEEAAVASGASAPVQYRIVPEESEVRFTLTEDLRGTPTTVIGRTTEVAGDIIVDFATPANTRVGVIRINARTLATDNEFRNRAIRGEILQSAQDEYEFVDFTPTAVTGLPDTLTVGEEITFQITGDLKVRNITAPATFEVTATAVSEDRLEGTATTVVTRTTYDLQIPNAPGVANVSEEVTLEIDFVATQVAS